MKLFIVSILLVVFFKSTTPSSSQEYFDDYAVAAVAESESSIEVPPQESRLLNLFKGWKGDDGHPLTEFGKIHIIKKGGGWGGGPGLHHGHKHGHGQGHHGGQGWGWNHYGPGYTSYQHTTGWQAPSKKKSWLKFPKKSFGIHLKGGVGFSFGGDKKAENKHHVVVHQSPGWGWNSGHGHSNSYGWGGWGQGGGGGHGNSEHGGHQDYDGGDYYDDGTGNNQNKGEETNDEDRRRMDLNDYFYDY